MPKIKSSNRSRLLAFIDEFGKDIFSTDGTVLFFVKFVKLRLLQTENLLLNNTYLALNILLDWKKNIQMKNKIQTLITDPSKKSSFYYDLCHTYHANIPLQKLQNDSRMF